MPIITFSELFGAIARFIIALVILLSPYILGAAIDHLTDDWLDNTLPPVEEAKHQLYSDAELGTFNIVKP